MSPRVRATVVVSTRDRPEHLRACLDSLQRAASEEDEIVVVDSASRDPEAVRQVASAAGVQLLRLERTGSARARNAGIRQSAGEIIAFTDDDAVVDPDWLNEIVKAFADPSVGVVVGPVFEMGTAPPELLIKFPSLDSAREAASFTRTEPGWFEKLRFGAIGSGANMAVRREVFERRGVFRSNLGQGAPICGDETFFLFSAVESGETVVNQPSAKVLHPPRPADRLDQLKQSSVAYLCYLGLSRPSTLPLLMVSLAGRLVRRRTAQTGSAASSRGLLKALSGAPAQLVAAWRFGRNS